MRKLDEWTLLDRIGSGGLADVWRARRDGDPRLYALKILREPDRSPAHRQRFLREGRLLKRLDHRGLPRCHGVVEKPQPYLVLELLVGDTLSARIREEGPLPIDRVALIAARLLEVLDYLHNAGIVHRDIKASNVFLGRSEADPVRLLDLGLAADPADPLTTTLGDVMGTYAYMAPEQIAGAEVDHRCDLYSLGITLYEALAGTRPFHARGPGGYLRAHKEGRSTPISELVPDAPPRMIDTVTRLMARDPLTRPASAAIALAMLTGSTGNRRVLHPAPLVGRAAPLGAIEAVLDNGGTVLLVGEIGAGTGRMASHALHDAQERSFETLAIRCRGRASPQDPLTQLARDLSAISGPVDPQPDALRRAVSALVHEGPVLLLIEDVEQCGHEAARLLGSIAAAEPGLSTIVTGVEIPPAFSGHAVRLRPLSLDESRKLIKGMLATPTPPAGLTKLLHHMAGGLPAIEVLAVKDLVARGALWCEDMDDDGFLRWRQDKTVPVEPTSGLARLFGSTLSNLLAPSRAIMEVLATVGEAIPVSMALQLAECDPSGIDLGPLTKAGLVCRTIHEDGEWLSLRRQAVGALVLGQVASARQTSIHARLTTILRAEPSGPWRDERLAWHQAHGATPEKAPQALLQLGEQLIRRSLHQQALDVLDRASRIPGASTQVATRLALARGEVLDAVGRREEAATALSAAHRLAEEIRDDSLIARALVGLAQAHQHLGDERRAAMLAEDALDLLKDYPHDPSLPRALLRSATNRSLSADPVEATKLYKRCITVAQEQGDAECAARAQGGLGVIAAEDGHLQQALDYLQIESRQLSTQNKPSPKVVNLYRTATVWLHMGRPDRAHQVLSEGEETARYAELPHLRSLIDVGRADVALATGNLERVEDLLQQARIALDPEAASLLRLAYRDVQARLRLAHNDRQAALAVFQVAEADAARSGQAALGSFFLGMIGVLTADPDAITEAMDILGVAGDRRLAAQLLLVGATIGGDAEVLESAERETRASGDQFLLLQVLHASGSAAHKQEATALVERITRVIPPDCMPSWLASPPVRWAGAPKGV